MTDRKDGGPAFAHGNPEQGGDPGMSLRDWLAGQALAGFLAAGHPLRKAEDLAIAAYNSADLMLAQRAKAETQS